MMFAEEAIKAKWDSLGGTPGQPQHPLGLEGLRGVPNGYRRDYTGGTIYRRNKGQPFFVGLATDQRYDQLGGPGKYLGFPVSDFEADPEQPDSGVTRFENGAIYFWPNEGAIEMREISLRYVGWHCFGETDEPSASDEIYFTFGVVPTCVEHRKDLQTRIWHDTDTGKSRYSDVEFMELYRGLPFGAAISITLMEHDEGGFEEIPRERRNSSGKNSGQGRENVLPCRWLALSCGAWPCCLSVLALPAITDFVNEFLGTEDDLIGTVGLGLTPKDMMRLTRVGRQDFHGIQAHLKSPLISGGGGSYKAYFDVEVV